MWLHDSDKSLCSDIGDVEENMSLLSLHRFISLHSDNADVEVTALSISLCSDHVDVDATIPSLSLHSDIDNVVIIYSLP